MPSSLRKALNELPITLDDTYERALEGIPKEKRQHAHRLFRCLVAAIRPLRVEELGEIFAIEFDAEAGPNLLDEWRPENPEEAVLSACSTLIAIIENEYSKIVQFSHFSVKEFLTSDRLRTSEVGSIRQYHISLDSAHTVLARACLTVLLQFDDKVDKKRLATFPLAFYAAKYWVDHVKSEDVASRFHDTMECLFNPHKPYLAAWVWIHNVDRDQQYIQGLAQHPTPLRATALYYAALCGFSRLANYLILTYGEDVNANCGHHGTALHATSYEGHFDVACLLLDHGADVNLRGHSGETPLETAYRRNNLEIMQLLLEHGTDPDVRSGAWDPGTLTHAASMSGSAEVIELLLRYKADVNARSVAGRTPLHGASESGHVKVVQLLLERGADVNARSPFHGSTPLTLASRWGHLEVVRVLLGHGADLHTRGYRDLTAFQWATSSGHTEIAQLLLEHGAQEEEE
jgi:ankyrin repeat protein